MVIYHHHHNHRQFDYLFCILMRAKPLCDNVLQPSWLRGSDCNTLLNLNVLSSSYREIGV